eukprot:609855-Pleurochrysis_carterae.AAC.1
MRAILAFSIGPTALASPLHLKVQQKRRPVAAALAELDVSAAAEQQPQQDFRKTHLSLESSTVYGKYLPLPTNSCACAYTSAPHPARLRAYALASL